MNACSFAAGLSSQESGVGAPLGAFHGQMGCIYLFEDVLNPGKTSAALGLPRQTATALAFAMHIAASCATAYAKLHEQEVLSSVWSKPSRKSS